MRNKLFMPFLIMLAVSAMPCCPAASETAELNTDTLKMVWREASNTSLNFEIKFNDLRLEDQLFNAANPSNMPLIMRMDYDVLQNAPVMLGLPDDSFYDWSLYYFKKAKRIRVKTNAAIPLAKKGKYRLETSIARIIKDGEMFDKGVVGVSIPDCLRVADAGGQWLRKEAGNAWARVRLPLNLKLGATTRKMAATVADLSEFNIEIGGFESRWKPGGQARIMLMVVDAASDKFPIVNVPAVLTDGKWSAALETEYDLLKKPTGWLVADLPDYVPDEIKFKASISALISVNPVVRRVVDLSKVIKKGERMTTAMEIGSDKNRPGDFSRNDQGVIRETRGVWACPWNLNSRQSIDKLVEKAAQARMNVIFPNIFGQDEIYAKSSVFPVFRSKVEEGLDPLAYLIEKAHENNIEVHAWIPVNARNEIFRNWFQEKYGEDIGLVVSDAKVSDKKVVHADAVDMRSKTYRDFVVNLIVDIAKNYNIDGVNLDHIRSTSASYSAKRQAEFFTRFGKPLKEATSKDLEDWWREPIGDVVKRAIQGLRGVNPGIIVSTAIMGDAAQGQNPDMWSAWGCLIMPMAYSLETCNVVNFVQNTKSVMTNSETLLIPALCLYTHYNIIGDRGTQAARPAEIMIEQVAAIRGLGCKGYSVYCALYLDGNLFKDKINREPAIPHFR